MIILDVLKAPEYQPRVFLLSGLTGGRRNTDYLVVGREVEEEEESECPRLLAARGAADRDGHV